MLALISAVLQGIFSGGPENEALLGGLWQLNKKT
jgi:hypothetical protein